MPRYPKGIRIEEVQLSEPRPIEGVETSVCGFLGVAERGPLAVSRISGLEDYRRLYGGHVQGAFLSEAVKGFFENGGEHGYVARVAGTGATPASACLDESGRIVPPDPGDRRGPRKETGALVLEALGPGSWGNRIQIRMESGGGDPGILAVTVRYQAKRGARRRDREKAGPGSPEPLGDSGSCTETFGDLTSRLSSRDYFARAINRESALIRVRGRARLPPVLPRPFFLSGGTDGAPPGLPDYLGDPLPAAGERTGLAALSGEDEIALLTCPDIHAVAGLPEALARSCEALGSRFAILHAGPGPLGGNPAKLPFTSGYAAMFHPWIVVAGEGGTRTRRVPPCGHVAGIFARVDRTQGVHRQPSGEAMAGVLGLAVHLERGEEDALDRCGVNTIRSFPGGKFYLWGAGTLGTGSPGLIATRRLLISVEQSILQGIRWARAEPPREGLMASLRSAIGDYLNRCWKAGALAGNGGGESFFVTRGRDRRKGTVERRYPSILAGIAPRRPGEFFTFRLVRGPAGFVLREEGWSPGVHPGGKGPDHG